MAVGPVGVHGNVGTHAANLVVVEQKDESRSGNVTVLPLTVVAGSAAAIVLLYRTQHATGNAV